jgi:hypothetical protein
MDINVQINTLEHKIILSEVPINLEVNGARGPRGHNGNGDGGGEYTATLGSVTTATIFSATHNLSTVKNVVIYHPDGKEVSIVFSVVNNNVTVESNINLLNHIIKIY